MKAPPSFQFYVADFLVGVAGMTNEQVGVYIKLLCYQWAQGGLPNDFVKLCAMTGCGEVRVVTECLQKFELKNDVFRNKRLEEVRQNHIKWITKSSEGGKKSALKRWGARHKKRVRLVKGCLQNGCNQSGNQTVTLQSSFFSTDANASSPIVPKGTMFEKFWDQLLSPNKVGKKKAREAWARAVKDGAREEDILAGVASYRKYEKNRRDLRDYRPLHPATWLNSGRWEDGVSTTGNGDSTHKSIYG